MQRFVARKDLCFASIGTLHFIKPHRAGAVHLQADDDVLGVFRNLDQKNSGPPGADGPGGAGHSRSRFEEESWAVEGRQLFDLGSRIDAEAYIEYLSNDTESKDPDDKFNGDRFETGLDFRCCLILLIFY